MGRGRYNIDRQGDDCRRTAPVQAPQDLVTAALEQAWFYQDDKPEYWPEMKIKVPLEYWIKLHGLKILNNQEVSRSIYLALEKYFQKVGV